MTVKGPGSFWTEYKKLFNWPSYVNNGKHFYGSSEVLAIRMMETGSSQ